MTCRFATARARDLLAHAAGLPAGLPAEPAGAWWERHDGGDFEALVGRVRGQGPVHPAGNRHHYTNLGFGLVGEMVARVRGASWIEVVSERVLVPLGMTRTTYGPQAPHAQGWSRHPYARTLQPEPHSDTGAMAPAGQLWSTVEDLARYASFWIDPDPEVLAQASVSEMCTPQAGEPGAGTGKVQGLGVRLHGRPPLPLEWTPEPEVEGAAELLGPWYWGNTPMTFAVRDGHLVIDHANPGRLVRESADTWRCLDHYFAGELLQVVRDGDRISHLDLVTYVLTRRPSARP